jgi:RNA polymerase sigma factor for flagellar operon FliA
VTPEAEALAIRYRGVAYKLASRMARTTPGLQFEDLLSVGFQALVETAAKFDPSRGAKFGTYAQYRVRGAILDEIRDRDWRPRSIQRNGHRWHRRQTPVPERTLVSLEEQLEKRERSEIGVDGLADSVADRIDLARAVAALPPRLREVLWLYYVEDLTLGAIGRRWGCTESRICQLHAQAVRELREIMAVAC